MSPPPAHSRRIAGQFAWATVGRIVAAILQALLLVLAARSVVPAEFGLLASMLGIAPLLQTGLDMGVATFLSRERAAFGDVSSVATALQFNRRTSLILGLVTAGLVAACGLLIAPAFFYMLPLAVWASAERTADVRLAVSFADGDGRGNAINLAGRRALALALFVAGTAVALEPLLVYSLAVAIAALASSIFAHAYVRGRVTAAPTMPYRELLRASWPYWLNSVATQARNLDSALTAMFAGAAQAGFFSVASRLTNPLRLLPATFGSVLLPASARTGENKADLGLLVRMSLAILAVTSAAYLGLVAAAPWLVTTFLGADYEPSIPALQIVLAGLPFAAAVSLFSSIVQGRGNKHFVATSSTITSLVCLVLIVVGAIAWGAVGAAAALSVSFAVQALIMIVGFVRLVWRPERSPG